MIFDLTHTVEKSDDLHVLSALMTALLGQPCLKVDLSYGDEFMLHVGSPVAYRHPKLANETKGAWILGTRASSWRLLLTNPPLLIEHAMPDLFSPPMSAYPVRMGNATVKSSEEVEKNARPLSGKIISGVHLIHWPVPAPMDVGIGFSVDFVGEANLVVLPSPEPDEGDDPVADWELFTPYHTYLRVGPGLTWSYVRSDLAAASATPA
ncbi:MAG: hypothetical protein K2R98_04355 [Gemmataceae bacterium]|nr:hypothetical protein [Gemmataceae bacterium]